MRKFYRGNIEIIKSGKYKIILNSYLQHRLILHSHMIWLVVRYLIFALFVIAGIYCIIRRKYHLLVLLYFLSFPFQNCAAYIAITTWNPYKIISVCMFLCLVFYHKPRQQSSIIRNYGITIISIVCFTALLGLTYLPNKLSASGISRVISQSFTYCLGIIPLLFMVFLSKEQLIKSLRYYEYALYTLIALGFIHFAFLKAGIPFAPIIRDFGTTNYWAIAKFGGENVDRIYGLCGEPKNMGLYVTPYVVWKIVQLFLEPSKWVKVSISLAVALFIFFYTYSSTAYIAFVAAIPLALVIVTRIRSNFIVNIGVYLFVITVLGAFWYINLGNTIKLPESQFVKSFTERSFERAENELEDERTEVRVLRDFQNAPVVEKITGYGPGLYVYHTAGLTFGRGYNPMQSGIVLNLVDFGVLGIFALLFLLFIALSVIARAIKQRNLTAIYFMCIGGTTFLGNSGYSMMGGCILLGMLPFLGIAYWLTSDKLNADTQLLK